jgi:hypothetical protein
MAGGPSPLANPIASVPSSPDGFVAASSVNGQDSADSTPSDVHSPQNNRLQAQARSFRELMSGNSAAESPSPANEEDDSSAEITTRELPLEAMKALLAGRDPVSARELTSWSALWSAYDDSVVDDSTLAAGGTGGDRQHLADSRSHAGIDVPSLLLYQQSTSNSTPDPQAVAAAPDPDLTFAELIERHVRRTLATRSTAPPGGDEVRIELTDVALPETALSLRRSSQGWCLLAVTGNRESLERLDRFAPALVQRFAAASLGEIKVETRLASRPAAAASDDD